MFRNSLQNFLTAQITSLVFAAILVAAVAAPLQASGVTTVSKNSLLRVEPMFSAAVAPESSPGETIRVQTWIPGFDDGEPIFVCSPIPTQEFSAKESWRRASVDACAGTLRMLPWISLPVPTGRVRVLLPIL